jgi:hypothetical protein
MLGGSRRRDGDDDSDDDGLTLGARRRFLLVAPATDRGTPSLLPSLPSVELPVALLCIILRHACAEGGVPTAAYAACVSRAWRDAVALAGAELWRTADLSHWWLRRTPKAARACDGAIVRLCQAGTCAQLARLRLAGGTKHDAAVGAIVRFCPALTSLDVSGSTFSTDALVQLVQAPRRICALNLASTALQPAGEAERCWRRVLAATASSLQTLSLAGCTRVTSATLRALLACEQLRSIDLTGAGSARGITVPVEALQRACPVLEALRLSGLGLDGGFQVAADAQPAGGFPLLRVCELASGSRMTSHGAAPSASEVDDALLARVLWASPELRELALGGTLVTAAGLQSLPALALRTLLLGQSAAACDDGARVAAARWGASLELLSVAGGGAAVTDATPLALAACARLREADLSGAAVTNEGVRALLAGAGPSLRVLTLASCRSLDRPVRRAALLGGPELRRALGLAAL